MTFPSAETRRLLERIFADLDYERLGRIYCDEGGDAFWAEHREPALRQGEVWARALSTRLVPRGASLYVGAGVAELFALVMEVSDLGRRARAVTLDAEECDVINTTLARAGVGDALAWECRDAREVVDAGYDHLSVVSVLNDPVRYPTVSGVAYGRIQPVLLDVERFGEERAELRSLVARLLEGLKRPGLVTTTFEEVAWFLHGAGELSLHVEADDEVIETAIVGDPVGFLRVT